MSVVYADLVLDTGELVRLECPREYEDEFYEVIETTMKRRDWFAVGRWDGCTATFMGHQLDRVNMARVIGTL